MIYQQVISVSQWCPTLCNPMDYSTPGFHVHHQILDLAQTHVHWVGDAIQPSHPLPSPSPPAFNLSQHQGLFPMSWFFPSRGQSIGVSASTSVLPVNIPDWFPLGLTGWISSLSKGLSRVFSSESAVHIRWSKYWSFNFSISPSNEYSGLISFKIDCSRDFQESSPAP